MQFIRKPRRPPILNIIPLIDVLVVLLIFYIATTVFKKSQPNIIIKIPSSTEAKATNTTPPAILSVTADGKMFLDDTSVDPDKLGELLKSKLAANPDFKVAMKGDTAMTLGLLTKIWDAEHEAGITDLPIFMDAKPPAGGSGP